MTIKGKQTAGKANATDRQDWVWVDTVDQRRMAQGDLEQAETICLDTEYDSFRYFRERLCLLQVRNGQTTYLFDPLGDVDFTFLGDLFHSPSVLKILHAGDNDIRILKRDYCFQFQGLFDTYRAASLLGCQHLALAVLIQNYLGVAFEKKKKLQRSRWDKRPLTREQVEYAVQDTALLLPLYERLNAEIEEKGLREEAERSFQGVCQVEWAEKILDKRGHCKLDGYAEMTPCQQKRLKGLYQWRFRKAVEIDRAAFMILPDKEMIDLVKATGDGPLDKTTATLPWPGNTGRYARDIIAILNI